MINEFVKSHDRDNELWKFNHDIIFLNIYSEASEAALSIKFQISF